MLFFVIPGARATLNSEQCDAPFFKESLKFGSTVLELVQGATEIDTSFPWEERKLRTITELPQKSAVQLAIIIVDKLHKVR